MIDIGANLANASFDVDRPQVLARARTAGIEAIIVTGTDVATSTRAAELVDGHNALWATAGVHPHDAKDVADGWLEAIEQLAARRDVVAIGETGLDFNRNYSPADAQRTVFAAQIQLAAKLNMPLFVHDRDSEGETARLLREHVKTPEHVVIHCFTGTRTDLDAYLDAGYSIGITGWVCDERRGTDLAALLPSIPDDRLLIESDAPYLLPRTMRPRPSSRRNEPAFLTWVVDEIARLRETTPAQVDALTSANARRLFRLDVDPD